MKKLDKLVSEFNMKEHLELFNTYFKTIQLDSFLDDGIDISGKKFRIFNGNDLLAISCDDGRKLLVDIKAQSKNMEKFSSPFLTVNFTYPFDDVKLGFSSVFTLREYLDGLETKKELSLEELLNNGMYTIENDKDKSGLLVKLYDEGIVKEAVVCTLSTFDEHPRLAFFGNGTVLLDGVRLSGDGKEIIEYKGKKVPSLDEINKLDFNKEETFINNLFDSNKDKISNVVYPDVLTGSLQALEKRRKYIGEVKRIYPIYTDEARKALVNCDQFKEGLEHHIFSKKELVSLTRELKRHLEEQNRKETPNKLGKSK